MIFALYAREELDGRKTKFLTSTNLTRWEREERDVLALEQDGAGMTI